MAQRHVTFRYDEFFEDYLVSSIILYLPLYGEYIANNTLTSYISSAGQKFLSPYITTLSSNIWNLPQYNYCKRNEETCSTTNCEKCFDSSTNCFECKTSGFMNRHQNKDVFTTECPGTANGIYVLKLPPAPKVIELKEITTGYKGMTINFFIKLFGFRDSGEIDIISLGDNLKISYNANPDNEYFGLNLKYYMGSSEKVISNYYDFRKHFGLWTFISVSTFNETYKNYFPPMVRFEINQKKMPIVGPLDYLTFKNIKFSDRIYALVRDLKIYKTYIVGAHTYKVYTGSTSAINYDVNNYIIEEKFKPGTLDTCKNEDSNYNCVLEKDDDLFDPPSNYDKFKPIIDEIKLGTEQSCSTDNCDICFGEGEYNCSCNFQNNEEKIFLGNVSNHYCKKLDYINFARADPITIPATSVNDKYSLQFWFFAHSYIEYVFKGLKMEWQNQLTIEIKLDSTNKYNYLCYVGNDVSTPIEIKMDTWNFIHCAADYVDEKKIYFTTEEDSFEVALRPPKPSGPSDLIISDLTDDNIRDWGILFYKHIRLWKNAFKSSSFLSRIEISSLFSYSTLMQQWNTIFNKNHNMINTKNGDIKTVTYTNKIGANIIPEDIYEDMKVHPFLCSNPGEYYDRKTEKCVNFIELSGINNEINIDGIDVAYSHNYGIAFWILMEDHKEITNTIEISWQYHMQISLKYNDDNDSKFKIYCFPQNYEPYFDIINNPSLLLNQKTEQVLNSATKEYENDLGGNWLWVQCSLSYNNRYYYLNEKEETLISETLYKYNGDEIKNDEPLGYFYNAINDVSLSNLRIKINGNSKSVYLRCLYLFKDYLPYNYNFKYMDMYRIDKEEFPPLTLAINFAEFENVGSNTIKFKYRKYTSLDNLMTPLDFEVTFTSNPIKELADNFIFLPLCNPLNNEK